MSLICGECEEEIPCPMNLSEHLDDPEIYPSEIEELLEKFNEKLDSKKD